MSLAPRGVDAALDDATRVALGPASEDGAPDARAALRSWLVLAFAAHCAVARRVPGAPSPGAVARARGDGLVRCAEDALGALGVSAPAPDRSAAAVALAHLVMTRAVEPDRVAALDEASLGAARESGMAAATRRRRGAHSTPSELAASLAGDTLRTIIDVGADPDDVDVLDPAAGGGALLLALGRAIADRHPPPERPARRAAIAARLCGVERDPDAAAIARAAIALWAAGDGRPPPPVGRQIRTGDVLASIDEGSILAAVGVAHLAAIPPAVAADLADALVDAFFAAPPSRRAAERARRVAAARAALGGDGAAAGALAAWAAAGRARGALHPQLAWPGGFDVAVLNPPFLGGKRIATVHGEAYAAWLAAREPRATGNADLAAHVVLATRRWLKPRAVIGIVATNTLVESATRQAGLERLLEEGHAIAAAWRSARWPGVASVNVVRAVLARGGPRPIAPRLDGTGVRAIDAGLRPAVRRAPPRPLEENEGLAFVGHFLRGDGFVLEADEAEALLARDPRHRSCLRPYLVGEDVLRDPAQRPRRWVIDFATRTLDEARELPLLLDVVERRVRPRREALPPTDSNRTHRRAWWLFANPRPELRRALAGRTRCIVAARVGKHLAFCHASTDAVFSEQLVVIADDAPARLGSLLAWPHDAWARAHSSSLQSGLRYLPSRAFATFPFPPPTEAVVAATGALLEARAATLRALGVGLTTLRDRLESAAEEDPRVLHLRELQAGLDRAVLAAHGFDDLTPPPRGAAPPEERERFELAVVERLGDENERRARRGDGAAALV